MRTSNSNKVSERTADPVAMERNLILELESCEGLDYMFEVKRRLIFLLKVLPVSSEAFVKKIDMVMHHHEQECKTESLVWYGLPSSRTH